MASAIQSQQLFSFVTNCYICPALCYRGGGVDLVSLPVARLFALVRLDSIKVSEDLRRLRLGSEIGYSQKNRAWVG